MERKKKLERGDHGVSEMAPETVDEDARGVWNVLGKAGTVSRVDGYILSSSVFFKYTGVQYKSIYMYTNNIHRHTQTQTHTDTQ